MEPCRKKKGLKVTKASHRATLTPDQLDDVRQQDREHKRAKRAELGPANNFPCGKCGGKTTVKDSRRTGKVDGIRRSRKCLDCGEKFRTYEVREPSRELTDPRVMAFKEKLRDLSALFDALPKGIEWDDL